MSTPVYVDTHCHIHDPAFDFVPETEVKLARDAGVTKLICVGENVSNSYDAVEFAHSRAGVWATIGSHPHEASKDSDKLNELKSIYASQKETIVAIGEYGLDYWYMNSSEVDQMRSLRYQLELAQELALPSVFHVRSSKDGSKDAFQAFFKVFDEVNNRGADLTGVVHSFSAGQEELEGVLSRGLKVGLNGIVTFMREPQQIDAVKAVPLGSVVLETDAPFLTPRPNRGKINQPRNIVRIAEFLGEMRGEDPELIAKTTSANAERLFGI